MIHTSRKQNTIAEKAKIRVIKKGEISPAVEMSVFSDLVPKKEGTRQMVAKVLNWIRDLETRKREETRLATERFQRI